MMSEKASNDGVREVSRVTRKAQPAHYLFKIESFSTIVEEKIHKIESNIFEVGDHKWSLCLYPSGNEKENGSGHISLYLVIKDTDKLPHGWELNVHFKLFVYDYMKDNYLTVKDAGEGTRRFHALHTQWGFSRLISLAEFNDNSNGYLFEDSCIFGAEIYIHKNSGKGECISWLKEPNNKCFTWKLENFSSMTSPCLSSDEFTFQDQKWKLELHPEGYGIGKRECLSLYLDISNPFKNPLRHSFYVKYKLRIKDQISNRHCENQTGCWFSSTRSSWGFPKFIKLSDLRDSSNRFLVKDSLIVEGIIYWDMGKTLSTQSGLEVSRAVRDVQPAHYLFKIQSFSTLVGENIDKLESNDFEVGGFKWRLRLYPRGDKETNGSGHISLYLVLRDTEKLPHGWELNVLAKLFIYNHIEDNYLTVQDVGKTRRFHAMKTEWGFSQLISLDAFYDTTNGYLFQDSCVFGAEVFALDNPRQSECVSWIKAFKTQCFTWKVNNFSAITDPFLWSGEFTIGEQQWKLRVYPKGNALGSDEWLSVFLKLSTSSTSPPDHKVYARYKLRIKDQISNKHHEYQASTWFCPTIYEWGYSKFKVLSDVKDASKGFLVKDTLIVEVEFLLMSAVNKSS